MMRRGICVLLLCSFVGMSSADDVVKDDNTDNLNTGTSWVDGSTPGTGDVAVWDNTVTGANSVNLGGNLSWGGLRIDDPGGDVSIGGDNTLTIGSSGLDLGSNRNLTFTSNPDLNGSLSGSTTLTLDSTYDKNWTGMGSVDFTGTLELRGGSASSGSFSENWLAFGGGTVSQTDSFHLDTGASLSDRGDFIVTDGWGDGGSKSKLTLSSLTGYGDFRSDWGNNSWRTVLVNQSANTSFQGRLVSYSVSRGIDLEKSGSGTLTLTGANAHRNTVITGGTLQVGDGGTSGSLGSGSVSVASGADLIFNRSNGFTVSNTLSGEGDITKNGGGRMIVNGDNSAGALSWIFDGSGNGDIGFSDAEAIGGTGTTIAVGDSGSGSTFFSSSDNTSDVDISIGSGGSFTWNGSTGNTNTLSGDISGAGSFTKVSGEHLILTGANDYTGATSIDTGTLQIGNGGSTGNIGSAGAGAAGNAVTVASGATLEFNRTGTLDYKTNARMRHVAGAGDIVLNGGVKMWNYTGSGTGFDDANSWDDFTGRLIVKGGSEFQTIRNGRTAMGSADVILGDDTTSGKLSQIEGNWTWTNDIELQGDANEIINNSAGGDRWNKLQGVISGSGNVAFKDPAGGMDNEYRGFVLTGANTLSGTLTVDTYLRVGGVTGDSISLDAGTGGSLGTAGVVINSGKRLTFSRSDTHSVANSISGDGELYIGSTGISGSGTQHITLSGSNTHTGGTVVNAGTLNLTGSLSSQVTVEDGATLTGTGSLGGGLTMNSGSTLSPGASPGTMDVTGNVTLDNAELQIDIWGIGDAGANDGYDQISISEGSLILDNTPTITVDLNSTFNPNVNSQFAIITGIENWTGSWDSTVAVVNAPAEWTSSGKSFRIDQGSVVLTVIPEPSALALLLIWLSALAIHRRRPLK